MDKIDKYIEEHASDASEALDWLIKQTHLRTNHARMLSGKAQGELLKILAHSIQAKRILELGTFTGFSSICLGSALGPDGHLDTLEINDELEDLICEGFERAGLSDRIIIHIGDCKKTLLTLKAEIEAGKRELYDLVYIDANKREYCEYYRAVFDMIRPGGLILADNVIWDGKVCQDPLPQDSQTVSIAGFNDMVSNDPRVESVIVPLRDGLNIIRKLTDE